MDQEQEWVREHSIRYRLLGKRERERRSKGVAVATFIRRIFGISSIAVLLIMFISVLLNWNMIHLGELLPQIAFSILTLLILNGFAWLIERLLRHFADAG